MKMRQAVETRIVVCSEIFFPRHEEEFVPATRDVKLLWKYSYEYVRDALRNGANSATVELYDGCRQIFKVEARDPYWYGSDRILINHVTLSR